RRNELTEFRYDAVLHVGDDEDVEVEPASVDWETGRLTLEALAARLDGPDNDALVVREIPNARVSAALRQLDLRRDPQDAETVNDVRRLATADGVDPNELWRLGEARGLSVQLRLADSNDAGRVDAFFARATGGRRAFPARARREHRELTSYGTDP